MKTPKNLSVDKVAAAIEADAGQPLPGLRQSLAEAGAIVDTTLARTRPRSLRASLVLSGRLG